jgi:plastocyanin domain-containing protein
VSGSEAARAPGLGAMLRSIAFLAPLRAAARQDTAERRRWRQARVFVRGDFVPDLIVARVGEPLRIIFRRQGGASSAERIVFPSLGRSATLPLAEDVMFEFVLPEPGEHEFTCQGGILRGRLVVVPR